MSLTGWADQLSESERALEPRSLGLVAFFDGWARAALPAAPPYVYPRRLDPGELEDWREGYREGRAQAWELRDTALDYRAGTTRLP